MAFWWLSSGSLAAGCCELVELPSSSSLRGGLCHPEPAYARGEDTASPLSSSSCCSSSSSSSYCSCSSYCSSSYYCSSSSSSLFWTTSHNPHTFYCLQHLRLSLSLFIILKPLQNSLPSKSKWIDPQHFPIRQTSPSIPNPPPNIPNPPQTSSTTPIKPSSPKCRSLHGFACFVSILQKSRDFLLA